MALNKIENRISVSDLLEKEKLQDTDLFIVEDAYNTKKVKMQNLKESMIEDNSAPASYRLYSSEKVQNVLDNYKNDMEIGIGSIKEDVDIILKDYIKQCDLDHAISNMDDKKVNKEEIDRIDLALQTKRNYTDMIASSDLDTSSDETKIKIQNLSQEVLNAMTGDTPVTPPAVPVGGWTSDNLANGIINGSKLANNYRYKGNITEGDINEIIDDGVYLITNNLVGVPVLENDEEDQLRLLIVTRYGQNNIVQELYYTDDNNHKPYFKRKGEVTKLHMVNFNKYYEIGPESKIIRELLSSDYNSCGLLMDGNLYDYRNEGNYIASSSVKNLPTTDDDYFINVESFGENKWLYRATRINMNTCDTYISLLYILKNQSIVSTNWYATSTISKSRFDGAELHLFGDGISYGIGASDISSKSMSSILKSKYGISVINHSLNDATYGNYDDINLQDRSILTQIKNASLSTAKYAIIFAGTNDFSCGKSVFGNDNNMTDKTFNGSINLAIKSILEQNPEVKILLATPIYRSRIDYGDNKDCDMYSVNDKYLSDFVEIIEEVADKNHIPCLNLFSTSSINKYTEKKYLSDGLHLTDLGHELIADKLFNGLDYNY